MVGAQQRHQCFSMGRHIDTALLLPSHLASLSVYMTAHTILDSFLNSQTHREWKARCFPRRIQLQFLPPPFFFLLNHTGLLFFCLKNILWFLWQNLVLFQLNMAGSQIYSGFCFKPYQIPMQCSCVLGEMNHAPHNCKHFPQELMLRLQNIAFFLQVVGDKPQPRIPRRYILSKCADGRRTCEREGCTIAGVDTALKHAALVTHSSLEKVGSARERFLKEIICHVSIGKLSFHPQNKNCVFAPKYMTFFCQNRNVPGKTFFSRNIWWQLSMKTSWLTIALYRQCALRRRSHVSLLSSNKLHGQVKFEEGVCVCY